MAMEINLKVVSLTVQNNYFFSYCLLKYILKQNSFYLVYIYLHDTTVFVGIAVSISNTLRAGVIVSSD